MSGVTQWWRKTGGLFAALLVAALVFTPVLDAFICQGEAQAGAASQIIAATEAASHDQGGAHDTDSDGHCLHGHCHHAAPYVPSVTEAGAVLRVAAASHVPTQDLVSTSSLQFGLKRPPRA